MVELTRTDNPVFLSYLVTRLAEENVDAVVFDTHTMSALGATIGAIWARVMVPDEDVAKARVVLAAAKALGD